LFTLRVNKKGKQMRIIWLNPARIAPGGTVHCLHCF